MILNRALCSHYITCKHDWQKICRTEINCVEMETITFVTLCTASRLLYLAFFAVRPYYVFRGWHGKEGAAAVAATARATL